MTQVTDQPLRTDDPARWKALDGATVIGLISSGGLGCDLLVFDNGYGLAVGGLFGSGPVAPERVRTIVRDRWERLRGLYDSVLALLPEGER